MSVRTKQSYLTTSPEKYLQQLGNGSSSTDSHTPTGKRIAAILQPKEGSSSPMEIPLNTPLDVTFREKWTDEENRLAKILWDSNHRGKHTWDDIGTRSQAVWVDTVQRALRVKSGYYYEILMREEGKNNQGNGEHMVTEQELEAFFNRRREVPPKS